MLDPTEAIIIGIVVLALVLWGPAKIPELAKALGRAKVEYQKAASEVEKEISTITEEPKRLVATPTYTVNNASTSTATSTDFKLIEVANSLGISTEGKTPSQIANEIIAFSKGNK